MRLALVCSITAAALNAGQASAQTPGQPPAATQPVARPPVPPMPPRQPFDENSTRINQKTRTMGYVPAFVEIYKLDEPAKVKLNKIIDDVVEAEVKYVKETHTARADARDAYQKAQQDWMTAHREKKDQAEITRLQKQMQDAGAKVNELQKKSPWSLEKIATSIEAIVPEAQAKAGRVEFEKRKNYAYLKIPPAQPTPPVLPVQNPPQPPQPLTPQTAQPTKFRSVTRIAPARDQWEKAAEQVITDRKFDTEQTAKARAVVTNAKVRVDKYEKDNADAYANARKLPDAAARDVELKKLDQGVNVLYDEMMLRIDNLSRADQMPGAATQPAPRAGATQPKPPGGH